MILNGHAVRGVLLVAAALAVARGAAAGEVIELGHRLEPVVDRHWIERLDGAELVLSTPQPREIALRFDQPWEHAAAYATVLKDGDVYRLYYRGYGLTPTGEFDPATEVTCYAESCDGVNWEKPRLGLHAFRGSRDNNIVLAPDPLRRISHNFTPFLDSRPGVPADERFKAVGGIFEDDAARPDRSLRAVRGGLYRLASADGLTWRFLSDQPIFVGYALDSQNCPTWLPAENRYAIYLRTWSEGGTPARPDYQGYRTVSRSVSDDFIHWSTPEPMTFGEAPLEHLYTNGTQPYFRAPHLAVAVAFRHWPDRRVLSDRQLIEHGVHPSQWQGVSDAVFLSTRGGTAYDRTFLASFIRPGPDPRSWHARNNAPALGVVPTGEAEMSLYALRHYTLPGSHLRRYVLRTDGFASLHGPYHGGEVLTKRLRFTGRRLVVNFATSAAGQLTVEVTDADGHALPGFGAGECDPLIGDELARQVTWRGRDELAALAGRTVRLRVRLQDANLYALQFAP